MKKTYIGKIATYTFKDTQSKNTESIVDVTFKLSQNDQKMTIKGFRVMKSKYMHSAFQEPINIVFPSVPPFFNKPIIFIENKKFWGEFNEEIYSFYLKYKREASTSFNDEYIDPDSIPI